MAKKESNYYFDSFSKGIAFANQASALLKECFTQYDAANVQAHLDEMHAIEHTADTVKHEMMERLVREFLPPIEREDIVELAHCIDDVTDSIEDLLRGMYMYNITDLREETLAFTSLIERCCAALTDVMTELPNFRKSELLRAKIIEINDLEEEGDRLYTAAMHRLYTGEKDAVAILAWTTMFDLLEKCCDNCEDVADMIEQVILKNN